MPAKFKRRQTPPALERIPGNRDAAIVQKSPPPVKMALYPGKQLLILACCRFSEPVAMTSSFPYLFFMIRDFHLTDDEKKIGRYAGLLASCFSFAQFFTGELCH
jgi:hypothetical protein